MNMASMAAKSKPDPFPNNTTYFEGWITGAQSLKPGCEMPNNHSVQRCAASVARRLSG